MNSPDLLAEEHSFLKEIVFRAKSTVLIFARAFKDAIIHRPVRFGFQTELCTEEVIALSESRLWSDGDNDQNWILTAGKIQNLRTAVKCLNGLEVEANSLFSFWKHVGYPGKSKGFVVGREIREGCIIPTVAGGLCQLSNALYDAALKARFKIIERHKHARVIKGSLAEIDRDATVKWNYLDLRFISTTKFRIEAELTSDHLIIRFRSAGKENHERATDNAPYSSPSFLNDCYSCGNTQCFKNPHKNGDAVPRRKTTFILDERWPEYEEYVRNTVRAGDEFIAPFSFRQTFKISRYAWVIPPRTTVVTASIPAMYRSISLRLFSKGQNVFAMGLRLDQFVTEKMVARISVESTHVVISQNLLPYAWSSGVLGGRTFDVLMTRLPMEKLHQRLDLAFKRFPQSKTLHDFRAPDKLVHAETAALNACRKIITPHTEIAEIFNHKSVLLPWKIPAVSGVNVAGDLILFPGSALGRKGAYEMRALAREMGFNVCVLGSAAEEPDFWQGVNLVKADANILNNVQAVVYPTYIEHQPRQLLRAIASGLTVITTPAAGVSASSHTIIVPLGDYAALKEAVAQVSAAAATK